MTSLSRMFCFCLMLASAIVLQSSSQAYGQSPDPKSKATGSISGHVTVGGKAAPGITVAAYGGETLNRRIAAAQSVTDSEGYYRLSGLAPTQYQIATLTPNLTTAEKESGTSYGFVYFGSSKNIVLAAGEEVGDIDLKLVRGGVITGRITEADNKPVIEERVALQLVDENGNPVRTASPLPYNGQMYQTDDRGMYRIYGLPAGHYKVSVGVNSSQGVSGSNRRGFYPQTFYTGAADSSKPALIELGEGSEAANIDIQVGRRGETFSVVGRVVDSETGQPIFGAGIGYNVAPLNQERFFSGNTVGSTGPRGEFRFEGIAAGRYGAYVSSEYNGGNYYSEPVYFNVVDQDVQGVEIKAVQGLSLSGVVVTDAEMQKDLLAQLAGLRVSANINSTSRPQINSSGSSMLAADGSFQIGGLRPGRVSISVSVTQPTVKRPLIARIEHDGIGLTQGFEIQPGQSISNLRVVLSYGTGAIRGTVRFEGGSLPTDSRTFITCKREGAQNGTGAQLDSRGHFVINNLAPGSYEVTLQMSNISGRPQRPPPPQKQIVNVSNEAEAEVTFVVDLKPKEQGP
jgi:protocatechuate 3,4-dioxygenase beta subunit